MLIKIRQNKQEKIKNLSNENEKVEKALEAFFDNEDLEYDYVKAQGSFSENEEAKEKVIKNMTPPCSKKDKATPIKKPIDLDINNVDGNEIQSHNWVVQSFIADVKTSTETQLVWEPKVIIKVFDANYWPGSIFQFAYNEYTIATHPFGWITKRRENDFVKLREYISKVFPQYSIPPLVTPRAVYDANSLKEKEIYFSKFMNDLLANDELRACEYLELFLKTRTEKEYKPIRKDFDKSAIRPNELSDFYTIDGKVSINVSPANEDLCKNFQTKFVNKFTNIFKNLEEASDEIEK